MIILTPASIASDNAKDEIGYAIDHGKRILPVLLEDCEIPLRLRRFQYVDFTRLNYTEGVRSAKELLERLTDGIAPTDKILCRQETHATCKKGQPDPRLVISKASATSTKPDKKPLLQAGWHFCRYRSSQSWM
jgi:hypothetical protein